MSNVYCNYLRSGPEALSTTFHHQNQIPFLAFHGFINSLSASKFCFQTQSNTGHADSFTFGFIEQLRLSQFWKTKQATTYSVCVLNHTLIKDMLYIKLQNHILLLTTQLFWKRQRNTQISSSPQWVPVSCNHTYVKRESRSHKLALIRCKRREKQNSVCLGNWTFYVLWTTWVYLTECTQAITVYRHANQTQCTMCTTSSVTKKTIQYNSGLFLLSVSWNYVFIQLSQQPVGHTEITKKNILYIYFLSLLLMMERNCFGAYYTPMFNFRLKNRMNIFDLKH